MKQKKQSITEILKQAVEQFKQEDYADVKEIYQQGTGNFSDEYGTIYTYTGNDIATVFDIVLLGKVEDTPYYHCRLAHNRVMFANCYDFITTDEDGMIDVVIMTTDLYLTEEEIRNNFMLIGKVKDTDLDIYEEYEEKIDMLPVGKRGLTVLDNHPIQEFRKYLINKVRDYSLRIFHIIEMDDDYDEEDEEDE